MILILLGISSFTGKGLSMKFDGKCLQGVRAHNQKRFVECGLGDKADIVDCKAKKTCKSVDFWIEGIKDKPLTWYHCGEEGKSVTGQDDGKCKSLCEQKEIEKIRKDMKRRLTKYAKDKTKLTEECIKQFSKFTTASQAYWTKTNKGDDSFNRTDVYCSNIATSQKCTSAPTTPKANGVNAGTNGTGNSTGNGTTNGATKTTFGPIGDSNFMLLSIINASIGALIMIIVLA